MPSLNFTQFVDKVESGEKPCTIRAEREVPIKVGDTLHLFTGMRHKGCRKLRLPERCKSAESIVIMLSKESQVVVMVGARLLTDEEIIALAHLDGFEHVDDFLEFFLAGHNNYFKGQLIFWL